MDISNRLSKVFLKVENIRASGPIRVRITDVSEGRFDRLNLTFNDGTQLSLNATNLRVLARAYGIDSNNWLDKEVELYVGEIQYEDKPRDIILLKPISPPIENKAPPKPEFDDQIPC